MKVFQKVLVALAVIALALLIFFAVLLGISETLGWFVQQSFIQR